MHILPVLQEKPQIWGGTIEHGRSVLEMMVITFFMMLLQLLTKGTNDFQAGQNLFKIEM